MAQDITSSQLSRIRSIEHISLSGCGTQAKISRSISRSLLILGRFLGLYAAQRSCDGAVRVDHEAYRYDHPAVLFGKSAPDVKSSERSEDVHDVHELQVDPAVNHLLYT